jgi:uracil-DNA glycosylase
VSAHLSPDLADLLAYLGEIGYGDLYLRPTVAEASPAPAPDLVAPAPLPRHGAPEAPQAAGPGKTPDAAERAAQLAGVAATAGGCTRCRLCEGRKKVVFGSGNPNAELMLIGEGPGAEEDRQGLPFVGPAGELLTRIIQAIDLTREEIYIANVVKCRPPGNRDPQPDEVAACRGYLESQIALVQPQVIVALGRVAAQTLLGNASPIGRMRGRWVRIQGVPAMVTYHPAALLRNPALKRPTWEDMQKVRDRLRSG